MPLPLFLVRAEERRQIWGSKCSIS